MNAKAEGILASFSVFGGQLIMQKNILLPQVELTMESVTVVGWLVKVGDQVKTDQPILEIESQKGIVEVPSSEAGHVRKLCVSKGDTIGEKTLLCILTDTAEEMFDDKVGQASRLSAATRNRQDACPTLTSPILAAPAARRLAKDFGIDLATVKGTGPGGRITVEDVQAASRAGQPNVGVASARRPEPATSDWTPLPPNRLALIQQMQQSLAEIPQFHIARQMDASSLVIKAEGITFTHRLVRTVALALAKHPTLRTIINGDKVRVLPVSVAVAMDTPNGLVAPAIRNADQLSLEQIAGQAKELRTRAEAGRLKREELTDAPFAISNLGMLGVDFFAPFVFHGQTAVLAVGRAVNDKVWFTLAVDHRVVDGAEAARFLEILQREIAGPLNTPKDAKGNQG